MRSAASLLAWLDALPPRRLLAGAGFALAAIQLIHAAVYFLGHDPAVRFQGSISYLEIAQNLVHHGRYALETYLYPRDPTLWTALRPPLYPLLLVPAVWALGDAWHWGGIGLHLVLGWLTGWLLVRLALHVSGDRRAGLAALALYATHLFFQHEILSLRETILFTALLLGFYAVLLPGPRTVTAWGALGGLAGLAYLTRPTGLVLLAVLAAAWVWEHRGRPRPERVRHAAAAGIVLLAVTLPWQVTVYRHLGRHFFPASMSGQVLYYGNNADTYRYYPWVSVEKYAPWITATLIARGVDLRDEAAVDHVLRGAALDYITAHPVRFLLSAPVKVGALYAPVPVELGTGRLVAEGDRLRLTGFRVPWTDAAFLVLIVHTLAVWLGVFLTLRAWGEADLRRRRLIGYAVAFLVPFTLLHAVTFGETRFRLHADMLLLILAAVGYGDAWRRRDALARSTAASKAATIPVSE
ncbi:MAG: glycosyltransferase family 39 protein [Gemmatimonadota bacterium]